MITELRYSQILNVKKNSLHFRPEVLGMQASSVLDTDEIKMALPARKVSGDHLRLDLGIICGQESFAGRDQLEGLYIVTQPNFLFTFTVGEKEYTFPQMLRGRLSYKSIQACASMPKDVISDV